MWLFTFKLNMLKFSSLVTVATCQILNRCLVSVKWASTHTEHPHYCGKLCWWALDHKWGKINKIKQKEAKSKLLEGHQYNSFQGGDSALDNNLARRQEPNWCASRLNCHIRPGSLDFLDIRQGKNDASREKGWDDGRVHLQRRVFALQLKEQWNDRGL